MNPTLYLYIYYFAAIGSIYEYRQYTPSLNILIYSPIVATSFAFHNLAVLLYAVVFLYTLYRHPRRSLAFILLFPFATIPYCISTFREEVSNG